MNSKALEVWLDERWYEALSQQLENETVEEKLDNYLDELISQLPEHVREKISREILAEDQQREQEIRASRRYSAFRIVENGGTKYFRMDRSVGMLEIAGYTERELAHKLGLSQNAVNKQKKKILKKLKLLVVKTEKSQQ